MNADQGNRLISAARRACVALGIVATDAQRRSVQLDLEQVLTEIAAGADAVKQVDPDFDGPAYDPEHDKDRLSNQLGRIYNLMRDHEWRTLDEIHERTGEPTASISAQLRHLRKTRFGSYRVERRHRGDPAHGLYEYRVLPPDGRVEHVVADVPDLKGVPDEFRQEEII